jgi:serine/threonine protein kinase
MRPALENLIGDLVDGKYRVDAMLGRGGMGAVFRAVHEGTSRTVALKVISPRLASEPEFLQRFQREARACGRLRHPNIVDVTDFGIASHRGEPLPYLVMEYLDGSSLADVLRQEANLPLAWCVDVIEQIGSAVDEAHRAGILHRDLKPDNIWLEPNRRGGYTVKVLDFGLAKLSGSASAEGVASRSPSLEHAAITDAPTLDGSQPGSDAATGASSVEEPTLARPANAPPVLDPTEDATLARPAPPAPTRIDATDTDEGATRAGSILGTPAYMAPEQILGGAVTPRTDVYSLGVIAYMMIAGQAPFSGSTEQLIEGHLHGTPPPIQSQRKDLPAEAAEVLMSALAKDPAQRPPSALAFAARLAARFETPGAFLHGAVQMFVMHLGVWLRLSTLCFLPLILVSLALSGAALLGAAGVVSVPAPGGGVLLVATFGVLTLALLSAVALAGAIIPPTIQAVAAPQRPISIPVLMRTFAGRFKGWAMALLPTMAGMVGLFALTGVLLFGLSFVSPELRPYLKTLSRPARFVTLLAIITPLLAIPYALGHRLIQRRGGTKAFHFLGAVMLVEGLTGPAALKRSAELYDIAGAALQPVQTASMIASGLLGFAIGVGGSIGQRFMGLGAFMGASAPLLALLFTLTAPFLSMVGSLTYLRARRAMGEPLDRVLADFERSALPADHWQVAQRDQIRRQISLTR